MIKEPIVDELKSIRDEMKKLTAREKEIKEILLSKGLDTIEGENAKAVITTRTSEKFNQEAFIHSFYESNTFNEEIKNLIFDTKIIVDEAKLTQCIQDEKIELSIVEPFVTISESKVLSVK